MCNVLLCVSDTSGHTPVQICMHVHWKNCLIAPGIISVADNNLWSCHAVFGLVGSCNDIKILDVSLLHTHLLDGSHAKIDFDYLLENLNSTRYFIWLMESILSKLNLSKPARRSKI